MFGQRFNQPGVAKPDKEIVASVLVADFMQDRGIVLRTVSGRIKGADKSDWPGVCKAIELFVQVGLQRFPKGDGYFPQGHGAKPFA